jgi:hypothetical protein
MKAGSTRIRKRKLAALLRDVDAGRFAIPKLHESSFGTDRRQQSCSTAFCEECLLAYC